MRPPTDIPRRRTKPNRVGLVLVAIIVLVLLVLAVSLRGIAGFYTDYLWFDELRLTSVWKGVLGAKAAMAFIFTALFFVIMWVNLAIADRIAPKFRPTGPEEQIVERYHALVGPRAGLVRIGVSLLFALIAGPGTAGQWNSWILFRNRVNFGTKDPLFHKDIGFFVFQLPFLKFVVDWLFAAVIIVVIVTAVAHYLNGGIRFQTPMQKVTPQVKVHLSVLLAVLALIKAVGYVLQRYELVYSKRGVVSGASYTDVKAQLPALNLLIGISVIAGILFVVNIFWRGWVLPALAVGLWALVSVTAGTAYPALVQKFKVQPTESTKEKPYIARNINATRAAFNIKDTKVTDFGYRDDLTAADLANNQETIRNVRLWDPAVLTEDYKRLQEIRNFYQFNDVDVDRYGLNTSDRVTQVLVAARELNIGGIPSPSWVNQHLVYTHGYGVVGSQANAVAPDGNPDLLVKDLPPTPENGPLTVTNNAIYFGEKLPGYAIVKTKQQEIDFTEANGTNHTSTYNGTGGVTMSSWVRRAALALRFGDPNPLISGFVTPESKAIYIRDIDERVRKAAPFLKYDADPYPVLFNNRILWIYDAYTTTSKYPYSQTADTARVAGNSGLQSDFNYVRNSVKVVIDAYDGSMKFYVMDKTDPLVRSYTKAFPKLFTDGATMDPALREHLRYPEDLFRVQTNMYGLYHMTDAASFYNKTDAWDIAQSPGAVGSAVTVSPGGQVVQSRAPRMQPYYLKMRLPGETSEDFLIFEPFVPLSKDDSRKDLTAFMVAKSDPANYGQLQAYVMPRQKQIDGPALVNARINQEPVISRDITLLGQPGSGSKVTLGNMLLVPIQESLLYIQPLYVSSENTPLPQLKRVIVVYADKVVMRDSLEQALTDIFGSAPPTLEQTPTAGQPAPTTPAPSTASPSPPAGAAGTAQNLLTQAADHYKAADAALKNGDLAGYQTETNTARDLVTQATTALATGQAPPTTLPPVIAPA
ncbi:MAG: uncharacterized protein V7605_2159 [Acidimicrobiaceae bacterium]